MVTEVTVSRNATMVSAQEETSQSECGILLSSILSQEIPLQSNPAGQPAKEKKKINSIFDKLAQTACI